MSGNPNLDMLANIIFRNCLHYEILPVVKIKNDELYYEFYNGEIKGVSFIHEYGNMSNAYLICLDREVDRLNLINHWKLGNRYVKNTNVCPGCKKSKQGIFVHLNYIDFLETFCKHTPFLNDEMYLFVRSISKEL